MKVDIATMDNVRHIEIMLKIVTKSLHKDLEQFKSLVMQLQDRIKILEAKND